MEGNGENSVCLSTLQSHTPVWKCIFGSQSDKQLILHWLLLSLKSSRRSAPRLSCIIITINASHTSSNSLFAVTDIVRKWCAQMQSASRKKQPKSNPTTIYSQEMSLRGIRNWYFSVYTPEVRLSGVQPSKMTPRVGISKRRGRQRFQISRICYRDSRTSKQHEGQTTVRYATPHQTTASFLVPSRNHSDASMRGLLSNVNIDPQQWTTATRWHQFQTSLECDIRAWPTFQHHE